MWAISALFIVWWLYVWIQAPTFGSGSPPNCNSKVKYVIFFKDVRATVPWLRWVFVTVGCLWAFGLLFTLIVNLSLPCCVVSSPSDDPVVRQDYSLHLDHTNAHDPNRYAMTTLPLPSSGANPSTSSSTPMPVNTHSSPNGNLRHPRLLDEESLVRVPRRQPDPSAHPLDRATKPSDQLTIKHIFLDKVSPLLFVLYGTVMLELTIQRNMVQPGENFWTFGQIVAVALPVGGISNAVLTSLLRKNTLDSGN